MPKGLGQIIVFLLPDRFGDMESSAAALLGIVIPRLVLPFPEL